MGRNLFFVFGVTALCAGSLMLWAQDGKTAAANGLKALGSESMQSLEFSASGFDFVVGQNAGPSTPWPKFNDKTYRRQISFSPWGTNMQRVRTQAENPPRGGGQQPVIGDQNQAQTVAPGTPPAAVVADELMMLAPQAFLKAAAAASDTSVKSQSKGGKKWTVVSFTAANKAPAMGYLNEQNLLERVETKIYNNVYGDMPLDVVFSDYKEYAGVKFPTRIVQTQGGYPVLDLTVSDVKPNAAVSFPNQAKGAPPAPAAPAAISEKLSDGMWLVTGGYAAIVADFKDYIVVIEGGQSDQRSEQVIAEAKRLVPNKQIRYLINTHAHVDHAGGLRAYVAEGATIVTHKINQPYYQKIWSASHSLNPDRLAKNPRKASFKAVTDKFVMTDGDKVIEMHHQKDFGHNEGMLLVWLPKEKIVIEADGFNPPPQTLTQTPAVISPYNQNLLANIERLKFDVQRIIPIHLPGDNRKVTMAELLKAVGRS